MLISGIVISFGYTAMEFINGQHSQFSKKQDVISEHLSLIEQIQLQTLKSEHISLSNDKLTFNTGDSAFSLVFGDSTTLIHPNGAKLVFNRKSSLETALFRTEQQHVDNTLIDYFELSIELNGEQTKNSFKKTYDASTLLKYDYERN